MVVGEAFLVEVFYAVGIERAWQQFSQLRRKHHQCLLLNRFLLALKVHSATDCPFPDTSFLPHLKLLATDPRLVVLSQHLKQAYLFSDPASIGVNFPCDNLNADVFIGL